MAQTRKQKEEVVEKLATALKENETVAFVNFHGLGVADTSALRSSLREDGVGYTVAKKTLIKRALEAAGVPGEQPALNGEVAIAYGKETAPARVVYEFARSHSAEEKLALLGGIFDGSYVDRGGIMAIAQIPSLDVLRGMFVNIINSPIQRMAIVLSEISKIKN